MRIWAIITALVALSLVAAACGGGGSSTPSAGGGVAKSIQVQAMDNSFSPDTITVTAGEKVTFRVTNAGKIFHTFTVVASKENKGRKFADISLNPGEVKEAVVTVPTDLSSLYVFCLPHEAIGMVGTIKIQK